MYTSVQWWNLTAGRRRSWSRSGMADTILSIIPLGSPRLRLVSVSLTSGRVTNTLDTSMTDQPIWTSVCSSCFRFLYMPPSGVYTFASHVGVLTYSVCHPFFSFPFRHPIPNARWLVYLPKNVDLRSSDGVSAPLTHLQGRQDRRPDAGAAALMSKHELPEGHVRPGHPYQQGGQGADQARRRR